MDVKLNIRPELIFLVLGLVFGMIFLLVTPPFQVSDETSHFFKAYDISEGHIFPGSIYAYFPQSVVSTMIEFSYLQGNPNQKVNTNDIIFYLNQPLNPNKKSYIDISNVVIYPPIPYLASAFVMFICKLFNLSPLILMYFGRIINLLLWAILVYFAIKITPIHKWVFLLLALMPMTLFQAASLSADSLNIGLSFLAIAMFLNFSLVKEKINSKDILILFFLILALILSKQGYALLLLLFFMIPLDKFENNRKRLFSFTFIGLPSLIIVSMWNFFFKNQYIPHTNELISTSGQISFILSNPFNFMHISINNLYSHSFYIYSFVGTFGWMDTPLPEFMVYLYILVLLSISLIDKNELKLNLKQRIIPLTIFSIISILILFFEFITFTTVGNDQIYGIQGRYFIPIAPLLFLLFYNSKITKIIKNKINLDFKNAYLFLVLFIICFLSISGYLLLSRYYI